MKFYSLIQTSRILRKITPHIYKGHFNILLMLLVIMVTIQIVCMFLKWKLIMEDIKTIIIFSRNYHKQGKIYWAKLLCFSQFSGVPWNFLREYKGLSLIVLNNEHLWPRQQKSIAVKTLMMLKLWIFNPANLSLSTVCYAIIYPHKICSANSIMLPANH